MEQNFFIGTYSTNGIYKLDFNDGNLNFISRENSFENCSYLCKFNDTIYSIIEYSEHPIYKNGYIASRNSDLSVLNCSSIAGIGPCFVTADKTRNLLFVANYGDGTIDVFSLNMNGDINKILYHKAHFTNSRIHCLTFSYDNNFLFAADLGNDALYAYKIIFDGINLDLQIVASYHFSLGSAPRHLVIENNNVYLVTEFSCELYHFTFSEEYGFVFIKSVSILPNGTEKKKDYTGCAIKISDDSHFIYTSIRGHNSISVFESSSFKLVQNIPCNGITPRDICLNNLQDYLLCANQNSKNISIFSRDKKTGYLNFKSSYPIDSPACIII